MTDLFKVGVWNDIKEETIPKDLKIYYANLKQLVLNSKSTNTFKSYHYSFRTFCKWCNKYKFIPVPAKDHHVAIYLSFLQSSNPSVSKINTAIYSILWAHIISGYNDPCKSSLVKQVKEGILRKISKPIIAKEPITPDHLKKLVNMFGSGQNLLDLRCVTMCLVGYAGFLRFNEIVNIRRNDIIFEEKQLKIYISKSKTDQLKKGRWLIISKTGNSTCPVNCLLRYLTAFEIKDENCDFVFRKAVFVKKLNKHVLRKGVISYTRAREILLEKLELIGLDKSKFGLHSLRSGGASFAANHGVSERLLKKHGRWKTDFAKDGYIRESDEIRRSVSLNLGI